MNRVCPLSILLVENHEDTKYWLKVLLEDLGHVVTTASTLSEAVIKLCTERFSVLICDLGLPDGTGWDLFTTARLEQTPFAIAISGFGMYSDLQRSRASGFRAHLLKPFKASELEKLLAEAAAELHSIE